MEQSRAPGCVRFFDSCPRAALEYFVNLDPVDAPNDLVSVCVEIPDGIAVESLDRKLLPGDWQARPFPTRLHEIGAKWLASRHSVCLLVPSVVIPEEMNLLINPGHPDFELLTFHRPVVFRFDRRMWK